MNFDGILLVTLFFVLGVIITNLLSKGRIYQEALQIFGEAFLANGVEAKHLSSFEEEYHLTGWSGYGSYVFKPDNKPSSETVRLLPGFKYRGSHFEIEVIRVAGQPDKTLVRDGKKQVDLGDTNMGLHIINHAREAISEYKMSLVN